jgi:hypothetical protein
MAVISWKSTLFFRISSDALDLAEKCAIFAIYPGFRGILQVLRTC